MIRYALAFALATPAVAQDVSTATALLTHFATRCGQIAADPTKAVSGVPGAAARIAGDSSLITHYESTFPGAELFFRQMTFNEGKRSDCSLVLVDFTPGRYDDLGKLIADNGATLFGTEVTVTGSYLAGDAVQMIATPGYPPAATLTHVQDADSIELILSLQSAPIEAPQAEVAPKAEATAPLDPPEPAVTNDQQAAAPAQPLVPEPATPTAAQTTQMEAIETGLIACLTTADDPTGLPRFLGDVGFAFNKLGDKGEIFLANGEVTARLSPDPADGFCTMIVDDLPLAFGRLAAQAVAAKLPAGTATDTTHQGCTAISMSGPAIATLMTPLNPGSNGGCDSPEGTAISLVLK